MRIIYSLNFVVLLVVFCFNLSAQNIEKEQIKEFYETFDIQNELNYGCPLITDGFLGCNNIGNDIAHFINPCNSKHNILRSTQFEGASFYLMSLLKMYETTKDKAYLIKSIQMIIDMQEVRNDRCNLDDFPTHKGWVRTLEVSGGGAMYQDGHASMPMAKLVYLIYDDPSLYTTTLPAINNIMSNDFGISFNTYGQFATWLKEKVKETIQWYIDNGYWNNAYGFRQSLNHDYGQAMNLQMGYATALTYIGAVDNNSGFTEKAEIMASLFYSNVHLRAGNSISGYLCGEQPVLKLEPNNSYSWFHFGWRELRDERCPNIVGPKVYQDFDDYTSIKEAVNYFVVELQFLFAYNHLNLPNNTFSDIEMLRFRNTLTQNIYDPNNPNPNVNVFQNAVDGTLGPVSRGNDTKDFNQTERAVIRPILGLMPLYQFDDLGTTPNVYDILKGHYKTTVKQGAESWFSGTLTFIGFADLINAQWDKECQSLSLYNRKLVYNQDFSADNILTIEPMAVIEDFDTAGNIRFLHELGDLPYAEPKTADAIDVFTIEPGITSNITAGTKVVLKPGFHAKAGSHVKIAIDPLLTCSNTSSITSNFNLIQGQEITGYSSFEDNYEFITEEPPSITEENETINFRAIPNPNSGSFFITSDNNESITRIEVYNSFGELVFVKRNLNKTSVSINKNCTSGMYFVKVWSGEQSAYVKVIIN